MNILWDYIFARGAPAVNHLQFTDDTLIFCAAEEEKILNVKSIFLCFGSVSGLKVDFLRVN